MSLEWKERLTFDDVKVGDLLIDDDGIVLVTKAEKADEPYIHGILVKRGLTTEFVTINVGDRDVFLISGWKRNTTTIRPATERELALITMGRPDLIVP